MKIERDERRFDFHDIGLAIKRAREASGMTQEQLAYIVDRAPRTIMYNENDGQHPSFNTFYQMVTMFDIIFPWTDAVKSFIIDLTEIFPSVHCLLCGIFSG